MCFGRTEHFGLAHEAESKAQVQLVDKTQDFVSSFFRYPAPLRHHVCLTIESNVPLKLHCFAGDECGLFSTLMKWLSALGVFCLFEKDFFFERLMM